jgi:hypothetical protein
MPPEINVAVTVFAASIVTIHVAPVAALHPVHERNTLLPAVPGAVKVTCVPFVYVLVNGVVPFPDPLLSIGPAVIDIPLAGSVDRTVNEKEVDDKAANVLSPPGMSVPSLFDANI